MDLTWSDAEEAFRAADNMTDRLAALAALSSFASPMVSLSHWPPVNQCSSGSRTARNAMVQTRPASQKGLCRLMVRSQA